MSSQVYSLLKNTRENKDMSLAFVASKTGISESTLHVIETGEIESLNIPSHTIEAYITRYGEFLGLKELPDYVLPKKAHNSGKLTVFDYFVRLAIIVVLALLIYHVVLLVKQTSLLSNDQTNHQPATHTTSQIVNDNDQTSANTPSVDTNTETKKLINTTPDMTKEQSTNPINSQPSESDVDQNNVQIAPNDANNPIKEETPAQAPINEPVTNPQTTIVQPQTNNEQSPRMPENNNTETTTTSPSSSTDQQNWHKAMQTAIDNASFSN